MLNIVISLLALTIVTVLLNIVAGLELWIASGVGVVVFMLIYLILTRTVMKKVGNLMEIAQRDLQANRVEKAIKTLESGFKYAKWQYFIRSQINAQIGTVYYLKRDFSKAFEYLQKAFVRHWVAQGMLGVTYMKRNKTGKMIETFDKATSANKKEPLLWNLYAFCLERIGERDKAIDVMERAAKKTGDERIQANLEALREGRKMKMKAYGDMWYQFHLEKPGAIAKQQTRAVQGRRKIVRR